MDDLKGQHFGGYELKELVGTGGTASIYKGFDEILQREVAIKMVPIHATGDAEETLLARFKQEAQAIARLRHRNILTIYSYGEEEGWAYIVMEYVPGGSLKDRIKSDQSFTWEQALNIIIPVSQALAFAHKHGVIHRDIKPANILLPQDDWPLLADFGLAKMEHSTRPNLTMPGQVLGTMAYAAPEQIQEDKIDARVDIYSLAIVLYELLTAKLPFQGETIFDLLMARLTDPPLPLLEANPNAPAIFVPIFEKALAQEPKDRYQSMDELSKALINIRDELYRSPPREIEDPTSIIAPEEQQTKIRLKIIASGQEIVAAGKSELVVGRAFKTKVPDIDLGPHGGGKAGVSRRHCHLLYENDKWLLEDLASTNGTFVNGVKAIPYKKIKLTSGDIIRCGQIELELRIE